MKLSEMKPGKWYKIENITEHDYLAGSIFDYVLTWSPEEGVGINSLDNLITEGKFKIGAEAGFTHIQTIKLPVKV